MRADLAAEIIAHNTGVLRARSAYQADQCFDEGICVRCQATFRDNGTSRECRACYRSHSRPPRKVRPVDWKAVRAWAAEQGIYVYPHGRIRGEIVDQYRAAKKAAS
jgi:hypothetical protein